MPSEIETLRREVNKKLNELNEYLTEANVEPVAELAITGNEPQTTSPANLRNTLDYLDVPSHADSRLDTTLHQVLTQLTLLEELQAVQ